MLSSHCTLFTRPRRIGLLMAAAGLAATLTACGSDASTVSAPAAGGSGAAASGAATAEIAAEHNEADVTFINDMTPHHTGAIAMAELAGTRAASPEVKALATKIAAAQGPEKARMAAMAAAWGVPAPASEEAAGGHGGGHGGGGMAMGDDVAALMPLTGAAFDKEFLTRMIAHHEAALPMAKAVLEGGANPQAKQLATEIADTQTAEIAQMRQLLTTV